jgi:hypothetical protein
MILTDNCLLNVDTQNKTVIFASTWRLTFDRNKVWFSLRSVGVFGLVLSSKISFKTVKFNDKGFMNLSYLEVLIISLLLLFNVITIGL